MITAVCHILLSSFLIPRSFYPSFFASPWQQQLMKLPQVFLCQNFLDLLVDQIHAAVAFSITLTLFLFSLQHAINWVFEANTWATTHVPNYAGTMCLLPIQSCERLWSVYRMNPIQYTSFFHSIKFHFKFEIYNFCLVLKIVK